MTQQFKSQRMENAAYWAAQTEGWLIDGPNAGPAERSHVEIIGGSPVLVLDETWNEETMKAILDGLREYGWPNPIKVNEMDRMDDESYRLFISEPSDERLLSNYDDEWREYSK